MHDEPGSDFDHRSLDVARARACAHLGALAHDCPDLFPLGLDRAGLSPRQNAFTSAVVELATRRWLTLRWLIEQRLDKPFTQLQPEMCGVLLSGAAQLVFLDGVPAYAAIDESVEWAKQTIRPGAGRLANAVLRRIADMVGEQPNRKQTWTMSRNELPLADGTAVVLNTDILPTDEQARFRVSTSCPSALYESMLRSFPEEQVRAIAMHNLMQPPTVINIQHALTPVEIDGLEQHERPGFAVYRGEHRALTDFLNSRREIWAQDVASAEAVQVAAKNCPSPGVIMDLCAGLGTKTRQLAAVFPEARIIATDTNMSRRSTLRSVFQRCDRVEVIDPYENHRWLGLADLILLDVPCSNTGVLARRVEARYRATDSTIESLVSVQRQIIADAIPLLAAGGRILYSTCSIDPRENHDQAAWAARQHGLRIDLEQTMLPCGVPGQPLKRYTDGSYVVILSLS